MNAEKKVTQVDNMEKRIAKLRELARDLDGKKPSKKLLKRIRWLALDILDDTEKIKNKWVLDILLIKILLRIFEFSTKFTWWIAITSTFIQKWSFWEKLQNWWIPIEELNAILSSTYKIANILFNEEWIRKITGTTRLVTRKIADLWDYVSLWIENIVDTPIESALAALSIFLFYLILVKWIKAIRLWDSDTLSDRVRKKITRKRTRI